MTPAEFERLADTYGAVLARWPEEARKGAEDLLRTSPALAERLARRTPLDAALAAQAEPVSAERLRVLQQRIRTLTTAVPQRQSRWAWFSLRELAPLAAGVVLALFVSWQVRESRPVPTAAAVDINPVVAMLEYDSNFLEMQ
jgi:hypothetical protein